VAMNSSLVYEEIISEIAKKNTLLVLSKGIKSTSLITSILLNFSTDKTNCLILMLNFDPKEAEAINQELKDHNPQKPLSIYMINEEVSTKRTSLYLQGGIFSISTVILTIDLLQKAISPFLITHLIINNAERIDNMLEKTPWITTMIRMENKSMIVVAMSDKAEVIHSKQNFRKLMQCLYLDNCSFWPLSRYEILKEISNNPEFSTYETNIKMSSSMQKIQKCIMNIMRSCTDEINRRYREKNKGENLIHESELFNHPINILYYKVKDLISRFNLTRNHYLKDLFDFRHLLQDLISMDSVSFYNKVLRARDSASFDSIWYICDKKTMAELTDLLSMAKARVYKLEKNYVQDLELTMDPDEKKKKEKIQPRIVKYGSKEYNLNMKLETHPKHKALADILKHIKKSEKSPHDNDNNVIGEIPSQKAPAAEDIVWIHASSPVQVDEIKKYLTSIFLKKDEHRLNMHLKLKTLIWYIKSKNPDFALKEKESEVANDEESNNEEVIEVESVEVDQNSNSNAKKEENERHHENK